jgi:DNA-binding NarL/FixJ family response regulator
MARKTVDDRLISLADLDKCPKSPKIAARARRRFVPQNSVEQIWAFPTPARARRHFCRILQKSTLVPHTHTREEAILLQFRQVSKKQQEIADAVGVTQKTVDNRLESLVNLDRCPKLLKIAALFEEAFVQIWTSVQK